MADAWFFRVAGREFGPLSPQQLRAMADQRRLNPEDQIRRGAEGAWIRAGSVKGLFAQPQAPPVPPPPPPAPVAPAARPVPVTPVPPAPRGFEQFSIVTEPGPPGQSAARSGAAPLKPRKQRAYNAPLVIGLLAAAAVLAIAAVVLVVMQGGSGKSEPADALAAKGAKQTAEVDSLEDFGPNARKRAQQPKTPEDPEKPVPRKPESDSPKPSATPAAQPAEAEWVDASQSAIERGDVRVRIQSATIKALRVRRDRGAKFEPLEHLLIKVELANNGSTRKIDYRSWGIPGASGASLVDSFRNAYKCKLFTGGALPGQVQSASIYPGKSVEDVLVFEKPIEKAEFLRLKLTASAFGGKGTLGFQIPASMIVSAAEQPEPNPPDAAPEGAEPLAKKAAAVGKPAEPSAPPNKDAVPDLHLPEPD